MGNTLNFFTIVFFKNLWKVLVIKNPYKDNEEMRFLKKIVLTLKRWKVITKSLLFLAVTREMSSVETDVKEQCFLQTSSRKSMNII